MTLCALCEQDSPRINMRNRCCKVRMISKLPRDRRQACYEQVRREDGEEALRVLIEEVSREYQRRQAG